MSADGNLRQRSPSSDAEVPSDQASGAAPPAEVIGAPGSEPTESAKPSKFKSSLNVLMTACSDEDHEEGSKGWMAHYEKKKFTIWSLLPPSTWLMPYIRTATGRATEKDLALAGGLPFSLKGDLISGLTVGVMLVPQCLAFAMLAGLPIQIGLYSSFAPLIAYALFGTIRQVQVGPTALMSLLAGQALDSLGFETDAERIAGAALCAMLVGVISVLLGALRVGFIVDFMSHSVMTAFCSAAGVTISTSQMKHMFGIKMDRKKYWWQTAAHLVSHLHEIHLPTFALGGGTLFMLFSIKKWKGAGAKEKREKHPILRWLPTDKNTRAFKTCKFIADLSSLLAVVIGWFWGLAYRQAGVEGVAAVGPVDSDGFMLAMPGKGIDVQFDSLVISCLVMAVVGFLETMAVGGKFAMQARYDYDPNQELIALGMSNIASAVMSGYPGTGSFSRTAVNATVGATSLVACFISSILVAGAVFFLLPIIEHLPLASLAPIIIQGALGVVSVHDFVVAFKATKAEFLVMFATFSVSLLLTVKEGLLVGFVMSVLKTMNDLANPNLAVCGRLPHGNEFRDIRNFPNCEIVPNAVVVRMDARLSFANSRKMKEFCSRAVQVRESQGETIRYIVVDAKAINHVDLTGCEMLEALAESLAPRNQGLIVANLKGPASKCLSAADVAGKLRKHHGHLCIDMEQALAIVSGADDGLESAQGINALVKRHDSAATLIKNANKSFLSCRSPKDLCSTSLIGSTTQHGEPKSPEASSAKQPEPDTFIVIDGEESTAEGMERNRADSNGSSGQGGRKRAKSGADVESI